MKKSFIYKSIVAGLVFAVVSSCSVTDLQPVNALSEEAMFETASNVELAVVGLYDAAQSGFYGGNENTNRGYIFGAAHIQQGDMRGEDMVLINVFYDATYRSTQTTASANQVNYWENGFRIINISNLVQEGVAKAIENSVITAEVGNVYLGEARLIRAMTYHTLAIHFARPYLDNAGNNPGLPIFTKGVNNPAAAEEVPETGRSTVAEIYDMILGDLNFAEANLPETRAGALNVTRATAGAAIALKSRVYLHMGDWANVIVEGNKMIEEDLDGAGLGGYALGETVDTPWEDNTSSESILSMDMSTTDNLDTNSALARMLAVPPDGRGEYAISPIIWNQDFWHEDDLRRTLLARDNGTRIFIDKYRDYTGWTDYAPVIRYAEVVLNVAEAESRAGDATRALALMNAIRNRAIPTEDPTTMTPYTSASFANGIELTQGILNERRIELLGEGERWSDITRLANDPNFSVGGIPAKMNAADVDALSVYTIGAIPVTGVTAIPYSDYRFLWPIPQSETTRNPTLQAEQNPGY